VNRLWSPWRLQYVTSTGDAQGCVFCEAQSGANAAPLVVHRGCLAFVILNLFPYNSGHLMVVPNRHIAALAAATHDERCELMGLTLTDVRVPADHMVGAVNEGFKLAMWALEGGRVGIAAQALGIGQAALAEALRHVKTRHTFGKPIAEYQAIQFMLSDMSTELDGARMLTYKAAALKPHQVSIVTEAAQARLAASEAAHHAADKAMQILASAGYRRGSKVERLFRDARATEIYQGTSETQRMVIADHILGLRRHA